MRHLCTVGELEVEERETQYRPAEKRDKKWEGEESKAESKSIIALYDKFCADFFNKLWTMDFGSKAKH